MLKVLFPWKQNNTKKVLSAMERVVNEGPSSTAEPVTEELPPEELPLLPCHVCNRTFLPRPLQKHIPICEQMARKKRKPFDSLKQRVGGTEMATFFQKNYLKKGNQEASVQALAGEVSGNNKQSKWREKHFELQKTIKNAKGTKTVMSTNHSVGSSITPNRKASHLTANPSVANERCPVCDRSFGPKAFDRHVEFCKEQRNRVQVHKSTPVVQQAKERLEARINYRVPPLRQSKRSIVRDKYSPTSQTILLQRSNSIASGRSTSSISSTATIMLPNRRQISNSNEKNNERNVRKDATSRTRLDRLIGDCGDAKELTRNDSNKSFHTKRSMPAKKLNKTDINEGLKGLTVSSLSVEKGKKLVTWKDTVKAQSKALVCRSQTEASKTKDSAQKVESCRACAEEMDRTFVIAREKKKTWKRRKKKHRKFRLCSRCLERKFSLGKWKSQHGKIEKEDGGGDSSEFESVLDSPQTPEGGPDAASTPTADVAIVVHRRSRSAGGSATEPSPTEGPPRLPLRLRVFRSLPDLETIVNVADRSSDSSFDKVIPRKRRKLSPSYLRRRSDDRRDTIREDLKKNIRKIRRKKRADEPPLILDYELVGECVAAAVADVLYVNEVFECSEMESVQGSEIDGIQEYGEELLAEWEAAEEGLRKELGLNKMPTRYKSPFKHTFNHLVRREKERAISSQQIYTKIEDTPSANTIKNCSASTIVNITEDQHPTTPITDSNEENRHNATNAEEADGMPSNQHPPTHLQSDIPSDHVPCRLPRIVSKNMQSTPVKEYSGVDFKLPMIGTRPPQRDTVLPKDKLVQVPSRNVNESASFCQQTSRTMVDGSSSFNAEETVAKAGSENSKTADTTPTDNYDPFEKAHLQLLALTEDDNSSTVSNALTVDFRPFVTSASTPKKLPDIVGDSLGDKRASVIDPPYHFQDSRTSSRNLDKEFELLESLVNNNFDEQPDERERAGGFSNDEFVIDPVLINEHDNLFIPERLPSDEHSPSHDGRSRRARPAARPTRLAIRSVARPLPAVRRDRVRPAPDGSSAESSAGSYRAKTKTRPDYSPEKSKEKGGRRFGTTVLGRQVAEEQEEDRFAKEKTFTIHRTPTAEELYPDNPLMYEEFRKYEEMYRREKEGKSSTSKKHKNKAADLGVNIEDFGKNYGDSAYGSLNRKQEVEELEVQVKMEKLVLAAPATTTTSPVEKLPKFCHECGNRYPVATAKFCVECGVKRLVL